VGFPPTFPGQRIGASRRPLAILNPRSRMHSFRLSVFLLGVAFSCSPLFASDGDTTRSSVDFKTQIRPILSNRCFACHGPDEATVESGLRLDSFETATQAADSGQPAIVPAKSTESELVKRILSTDEDQRMPPPHFGEGLTERETDLIRQWIDEGAVYSKHWSFEPPRLPAIDGAPKGWESQFPEWHHAAIDRLVWAKLVEKGWRPSAPADPQTLLRRVCLDLTGLPPTLEQQQAFRDDSSLDAYERLVDALLASPAYGEHWGRKWLDLARYADSAGYADDPARTIWAYRDWVIRAFNSNMPFDQFTVEQLAGDLLPDPTPDQLVATAFHRNTLTNNEGGTNDEEFRNVAIVDRVNTTMAVWMGVTMGCAQCHSHKYDPISQTDYFQVFAIFNQTEDADRTDESPTHAWFSPEQRQRRDTLVRDLEQIEAQIAKPDPELGPEQEQWETKVRPPMEWLSVAPSAMRAKSGAALSMDPQGRIDVPSSSDDDTLTLDIPLASKLSPSQLSAIRIRTHPDPNFPGGGAGLGDGNFVLTNLSASFVDPSAKPMLGQFVRIELPGKNRILSLAEVQVLSAGQNVALRGKATQSTESLEGAASRAIDGNTSGLWSENSVTHTETSESPWWEVDLGSAQGVDSIAIWNRTDSNLLDRLSGAKILLLNSDRKEVWSAELPKADAENRWTLQTQRTWKPQRAKADYEQSGFTAQNAIDADPKSGWAVGGAIDREHVIKIAGAVAAEATPAEPLSEGAFLRVQLGFDSQHKRAILGRFSIELSVDPRAMEMLSIPSDILEVVRDPKRAPSFEDAVHGYYVRVVTPSRTAWRQQRDRWRAELESLKPITTVPILRELAEAKQRETRIQLRGNYRVTGDVVGPGLPQVFLTSATTGSESSMNRLGLAQWLVSPDNPMTARVIANRTWETLFGVGIVRTSEDFGSQGDLPTNLELLDFLALDLVRSGWDMKRFLRSIVTSATYRQRSSVDPQRYEEDPENQYFSRGPRFRVTAEQVRDMALESAGLLSHRFYGPPTRPPQPSMGLSAAFGSRTDWDTSQGEDRYRRALYTQWRRSNPYPSMATFDAPNREVCVLKRDRTNTPLQALVTLNDPVYIEAAQGLARRVVLHELPEAQDRDRIERLFQVVLARKPNVREMDAIERLLREATADYGDRRDQANRLASEPLGPLPEGADPVAMAAWTTVCNVVLNLDEFLMTP
jgi:hypothetical protein